MVVGILASIVSLCGFIPYILGIIKNTTRPNIVSWSAWTILSFISAIACYYSGARQNVSPWNRIYRQPTKNPYKKGLLEFAGHRGRH